ETSVRPDRWGVVSSCQMNDHPTLLGLLVLCAAACGSNSRPPTTPSIPSATAPSVAVRGIAIGENVTGTLQVHGAKNVFVLTAPSSGTLVARLSWSSTQ